VDNIFLILIVLDYFDDFFVYEYLETPGERLFKFERHSVHSKVIKIRVPLFFAIKFYNNNFILLYCLKIFDLIKVNNIIVRKKFLPEKLLIFYAKYTILS
jgi:hypothetical protein